jgi:hypothetical protein
MERKTRINRKNVAGSIDDLLLELSGTAEEPAAPAERPEPADAEGPGGGKKRVSPAPGFIILAVAVLISWAPVALQILYTLLRSPRG